MTRLTYKYINVLYQSPTQIQEKIEHALLVEQKDHCVIFHEQEWPQYGLYVDDLQRFFECGQDYDDFTPHWDIMEFKCGYDYTVDDLQQLVHRSEGLSLAKNIAQHLSTEFRFIYSVSPPTEQPRFLTVSLTWQSPTVHDRQLMCILL